MREANEDLYISIHAVTNHWGYFGSILRVGVRTSEKFDKMKILSMKTLHWAVAIDSWSSYRHMCILSENV